MTPNVLPSELPMRHNPVKITVLGAGSFGTAMATIAARRGHEVMFVARSLDHVKSINEHHVNPKCFAQYQLLPNITATTDVALACANTSVIPSCLPTQSTPAFFDTFTPVFPPKPILSSRAKAWSWPRTNNCPFRCFEF